MKAYDDILLCEYKCWLLASIYIYIYIYQIKAQGLKCRHVWSPNQRCVTADEEEAALHLLFIYFYCTWVQKQLQ